MRVPHTLSLARVLAAANRKAEEAGVDPARSLVSVSQQPDVGESVWRVEYGPRDYVGRRGGEVAVDVDAATMTVARVLRGQ